MKVYFFETPADDEAALRDYIAKEPALSGASASTPLELIFSPAPLTRENAALAADADVVSVFVHSIVDAAALDSMPKAHLLVTRSVGFDHIDLVRAAARDLTVCNVPAYGARPVAEFTFSLILGLSRHTFAATRQVKDRHDLSQLGLEGFNLYGKTLGIIGTGRIGLNVAKIAKGFGMKVLGFDRFPNQSAAQEIGFAYADLEQLLGESDIITLHAPYTKETHHLINKDSITKIKKGALLVNTARGELIDTEALIYALDQKIVAAAALDVIEGERDMTDEWSLIAHDKMPTNDAARLKMLLEEHMCIDRPEVFITPHIAFYTVEAKQEILQTTAAAIAAFAQGAPINIIKPIA